MMVNQTAHWDAWEPEMVGCDSFGPAEKLHV